MPGGVAGSAAIIAAPHDDGKLSIMQPRSSTVHFKKLARWTLGFRAQMILLVGALVLMILSIQGFYLNQRYAQLMEYQIGQRALNVARTLAANPTLVQAFDEPDPSATIQYLAEAIRLSTGASFVVVGNRDSIRYAHPLPERIGQRMVGEDNDPALLKGEEYISVATGSLGPSIRGKVPVRDSNQAIIGVISVGFLASEVGERIEQDLHQNLVLMMGVAFVGLVGAFLIANRFKKVILGLEPHEIALQFKQKEAILQSIHEGIIAVDHSGRVTLANSGARKFLHPEDRSELVGRNVTEALPHSRLQEVLQTGEAQYDRDTWVGDQLVVVNRVPIVVEGQVEGAVATFRSRTEILDLSRSLAEVRQLADSLREQAHDFSNKLHTLAGLLQLGRVQEAIEMIGAESALEQARLTLLQSRVKDAALSGLLAGKIMRARQQGIEIDIDEGSMLEVTLSTTGRDALLTIVGNLLDNACEAPRALGQSAKVGLSFTDMGEDIVFEVEDNGSGVPLEWADTIFHKGISTKGSDRGIGLSIVRQLCVDLGGDVTLEPGSQDGACFVAVVKKHKVMKV
jgi:two-component system CitB family sensor kinase/CitB family two-component system sensor histidine kinase CitS